MPAAKKTTSAKTPARTAAPRKAGRRPKNSEDGNELSRDAVIRCAIDIAQKESIDEVSMVRVARDLGVAPGLIHYYAGSRSELLSAVLNAAFRERVAALPELTGDWRVDLEQVCRSTLETLSRWPGVANYIATQNRFRLFQRVKGNEIDYGLAYFDHLGRILEQGGFTPTQAALAYDLTMMFLTSLSAEYANRQAPSEHQEFILNHVAQFDRKAIRGAAYMVGAFVKIDHEKRFSTGLKLLMDGYAGWLQAHQAQRRKPRQSP